MTFTGPVNMTGSVTFNIVNNVTVDFAGGLGEVFASSNLTKSGNGFLVLSAAATYSGSTTVSDPRSGRVAAASSEITPP